MPPPRKIDRLPEDLRRWLQEELKRRNFADYEALAEDLAFRCEEEGLEIRIGKSAIHSYGQEFRDYARAQEQAQSEIRAFLEEADLSDEVNVTNALFQQLTTLQWRLQMTMADPDNMPDPRGLNLGRLLALLDAV